ncbi:MAG: nuclear transport factor 2 family protein [Solirubrobacterales bacterium]
MSEYVETVKSAYAALNEGDIEGALAALHRDAEWHESGALPDASVARGREEIKSLLDRFLSSWDQFEQRVEATEATGDRVLALIHLEARGAGSGASVEADYAHVWTMRDGLGARVDAYYDREAATAALERDSNSP